MHMRIYAQTHAHTKKSKKTNKPEALEPIDDDDDEDRKRSDDGSGGKDKGKGNGKNGGEGNEGIVGGAKG